MHLSPIASQSGVKPISRCGWWACRLLCLAWIMSAAGCFEKTYADRMQVTVKFYDHLDLLNRNLGSDWADPSGFKFRAPRGFEFIPKPVPPTPDPNDPMPPAAPEEPLEDLRQPSYLSITLPGLIAAWQKTVNVDEPSGPATRTAYIYVLSNAGLFSVSPDMPGRIDPAKFDEYSVNLLAGNLGVQFKEDDWRREDYPLNFNLVPKVSYNALMLLPDRQFEGAKTSFKVYLANQGDIQTMVLFVYPDTIRGDEKLTDRIGLSLETLRMPASSSAAASAASGAPAASGAKGL